MPDPLLEHHPAGCTGCTSRRDFVRDSLETVAAVLGLSIAAATRLDALETPSRVDTRGAVRYPIPAADGVLIDRKHEVILARSGDEVYAFALACPHQNTALSALPRAAGFQCPRHKSRYRPDGTFISGRATRNMDRLLIAREADQIVVDPDVSLESDKDAARWSAAAVRL